MELAPIDEMIDKYSSNLREAKAKCPNMFHYIFFRNPRYEEYRVKYLAPIESVLRKACEQRNEIIQKYENRLKFAKEQGVSNYDRDREVRKIKKAEELEEKRIRKLEHSKIVRSEQARLKRILVDELTDGQTFSCYYCEEVFSVEELELEHKIPVSRKGTNKRENLVLACQSCNRRKGKKTEKEFKASMDA